MIQLLRHLSATCANWAVSATQLLNRMELCDALFRMDEQPAYIERIPGFLKVNHGVHPTCMPMVLFMMCTIVRVLFMRRESGPVVVSHDCVYGEIHHSIKGGI